MKIVFATNNLHKINEINSVVDNIYHFIGLSEAGIVDDIPEEEETLEGNALAKAKYVHKITGLDVFADDTGLEVDSLGNRPGVYSARYAGEQRDSEDNIDKILAELGESEDRKARFRTIIALIIDDKEYLFEGEVTGIIAKKRKGKNGFGYDPVFIPSGFEKSFAEMSIEEKNSTSHRARAVKKLVSFLDSYRNNK